ncbi:F-box/LRR-repeat protein 2-like isoform X2 [Watersipora subatra]
MTLMYELSNRLARKIRRMAFLSIVHSHGLPDQEANLVMRIKNDELPTLEYLAAQSLLNVIATGRIEENALSSLPSTLHCFIAAKITQTGISLPSISLQLAGNCLKSLDLTCNKQNGLTMPILCKLRSLRLHKLVIENNEFITDKTLAHIAKMTTLRYLSLAGCQQVTNLLFNHLKELKNLKYLNLSSLSRVTTAGVEQLNTDCASSLEYIDLSKTSIEDTDNRNIFHALQRYTRLVGLNLSAVKKLQSLNCIEVLKGLRQLIISHNTLSRCAARNLGQLEQLEHLDMEGSRIYDFDYQCLQHILELPYLQYFNANIKAVSTSAPYRLTTYSPMIDSMNLTTLCIANNSWLTDRMLSLLLKPLSRLLELDLSLTSVSAECIKTELPSLSHLQTLGLQGLRLQDEDLLFLGELTKLRKLNINDTPLGDTFLTDKYLNRCRNLELMSFCRTQITDKGLSSVRLKRLKTLWLDECNVTVGAALALSSNNCPNLSYISMQSILPSLENEDEENLAADILFLAE